MRPKIIVFAGVGNTGKSYVINKLKETGKYDVYNENARKVFHLKDNPVEFQKEILKLEKERLEQLVKTLNIEGHNKTIIIDRTFYDNYIYYLYNLSIGKIRRKILEYNDFDKYLRVSKKVYNEIILFNEPLKETKMFPEYNSKGLNNLFKILIKNAYRDKVKIYKNSYDYIENDEFGKKLKNLK